MANLVNGHGDGQARNISDPFLDLLSEMDDGPRSGMVQRLAVGYYEGWRPTRTELANLIAREAGRMTEAEYLYSRRSRNSAASAQPPGITGSRLTPKDFIRPRPPQPPSGSRFDDATGPTSAARKCRRSPWRAESWFQPRTSSPAVCPVEDGCSVERGCIDSYPCNTTSSLGDYQRGDRGIRWRSPAGSPAGPISRHPGSKPMARARRTPSVRDGSWGFGVRGRCARMSGTCDS